MKWMALWLLGLAGFTTTDVALAEVPANPLCRRDEVVQELAREMRRRNFYAAPDLSSILEWATQDPNLVSCTALSRVEERTEDGLLRGIRYYEVYNYQVRISGNRFTLRFLN